MEIIFLRRSTFVGKTDIAHILENKLSDSVCVHLDDFNIKTMEEDKETLGIAYRKVLEKISSLYEEGKKYLIVEGIIWDKVLLEKFNEFLEKNGISSFWFMIKRSPNKIKLSKKGIAKNPPEKLLKIQEKLDELKIENEKTVLNDNNINKSVDFILSNIKA